MFDPRYTMLRIGSSWKLRMLTPGTGYGEGDHPGDCGSVNPGTMSRRWGHPGDYGHVISGTGSGRGLSWAMDMRTQEQGLGECHSGDCRYLTPGTGSGKGVTPENVDM